MSQAQVQDGGEGMVELVLRVGPRMRRFLARRGVPEGELDDLIQDALLGLVRHWPTIRCPEAWLMGAVRLRLYRYIKARGRCAWLVCVEPSCLESWAPVVAPPQERAELLWDLITLSRLLPRPQWLLLYLRFGLGFSPRETAALLGYRPGSIQKLSSRALRRLRQAEAGKGRPLT